MERVQLSFTLQNVITVNLMVIGTYVVIVLATQLFRGIRGKNA